MSGLGDLYIIFIKDTKKSINYNKLRYDLFLHGSISIEYTVMNSAKIERLYFSVDISKLVLFSHFDLIN